MTRQLQVIQGPRTRGDCAAVPRPCPFRECRYHLTDAKRLTGRPCRQRTANIDADESCALDVADRGPHTQDEVGALLGISHGRVQQIIAIAGAKLARVMPQRLRMTAEDLGRPWSSAPGSASADDEWFDGEFKEAVAKAYERIVPPEARGKKMLRSGPGRVAAPRNRNSSSTGNGR